MRYKAQMTRAEAVTAIAEIDEILNAGASTVTIGDRTVTYDIPGLRRRREKLAQFVRGNTGGVRVGRYNRDYSA